MRELRARPAGRPNADPVYVADQLKSNLELSSGSIKSVKVEDGIAQVKVTGATPKSEVQAMLNNDVALATGVGPSPAGTEYRRRAFWLLGGLGGLAALGGNDNNPQAPLAEEPPLPTPTSPPPFLTPIPTPTNPRFFLLDRDEVTADDTGKGLRMRYLITGGAGFIGSHLARVSRRSRCLRYRDRRPLDRFAGETFRRYRVIHASAWWCPVEDDEVLDELVGARTWSFTSRPPSAYVSSSRARFERSSRTCTGPRRCSGPRGKRSA